MINLLQELSDKVDSGRTIDIIIVHFGNVFDEFRHYIILHKLNKQVIKG